MPRKSPSSVREASPELAQLGSGGLARRKRSAAAYSDRVAVVEAHKILAGEPDYY